MKENDWKENSKRQELKYFQPIQILLLIKSAIPDFAKILIDSGIMITDLSGEWLNDFYTISIGLPEENNALLTAINNIITN